MGNGKFIPYQFSTENFTCFYSLGGVGTDYLEKLKAELLGHHHMCSPSSMIRILCGLCKALSFKDLSTIGGLLGLCVGVESRICMDGTGDVGNTDMEGKSGNKNSLGQHPPSQTPVQSSAFLFLAPSSDLSPQRQKMALASIVAASACNPLPFLLQLLMDGQVPGKFVLLLFLFFIIICIFFRILFQ